ncbi:hypothetical protein D9V28_11620 [Mycetocola zhadangensis]|uniref:Uncharacterized protein n=1 Tax=Mycetocola zhadangensis TaxID=1164595 RepID=A0A3L7IWK5_9MICO|nr:hypothetical protein D9V28_11620 [Mycetocola zhadangensis]
MMLTVAVERRSIAMKIRRLGWFRDLSVASIICSFVGLWLVLAGVQMGGLGNPILAIWAWILTVVSVTALAMTLIGVLVTAEVEEDTAEAAHIAD